MRDLNRPFLTLAAAASLSAATLIAAGPTSAAAHTLAPGCGQVGHVRSINSNTALDLSVENGGSEIRRVKWIDFDGQLVEYAELAPGEIFDVQTYLTHPWMITDVHGDCRALHFPQSGIAAIIVD